MACENDEVIPNEKLIELATAPASMSSDGRSVTERSAGDLIALDKYIRGKKSACVNKGWGGIGITRASLPDTRGNV